MYTGMWKRAIIGNTKVKAKATKATTKTEEDATEVANTAAEEASNQWIYDILSQTTDHYAHIAGHTTETIRIQVLDAVERGMLRQGGEMVAKCQALLCDEYRLVNNEHELFRGRYIRWISAAGSADAKLVGGGFLSNIVNGPNGIQITWTSVNRRRAGCISLNPNKYVVFQALTQNEKMCLELQKQQNRMYYGSDSSDSDYDSDDSSSDEGEGEGESMGQFMDL